MDKAGGDEASEGTPDIFALARELLLRRLDLVSMNVVPRSTKNTNDDTEN